MEREEPYTEEEINEMRENDLHHEYVNKNNMTNTAKIEACDFIKTFDSRNGKMFSYKLTMSNGQVGSINTKTEWPEFLQVGKELMYAVQTDEKYGDKFTRLQPDKDKPSVGAFKAGQNFEETTSVQTIIVRQNVLQRAFDYYANGWHQTGQKPSPKDLTSMAEEFEKWVMR